VKFVKNPARETGPLRARAVPQGSAGRDFRSNFTEKSDFFELAETLRKSRFGFDARGGY
jgi:hypothetical protein